MKRKTTLAKDWWKKERKATEPLRLIAKAHYPIGTKKLTVMEASKELGVSRWAVDRYIKAGLLDAIPKLRGWLIPEVAIYEFRDKLAEMKKRAG